MWHDADPEFDEDGGEEDGPLLVSAAVSSGPVGGLGGRRLTAEAAAVVAVEDVEEDAAGGGRSLQLPEPEEVAAAQDPTARWTPRERVLVLVFASVAAFLQPIAANVYTPVLAVIRDDLGCTNDEIIATISVYLAILGFMPLVWGPFSDAYGRRRALMIAAAVYTVTNLGCALAWDVWSLMVVRALQAVGSSAMLTVGAGAIADTFPKKERGRAMGYYLMGPLIGPVIGPSVGGVIAQFLGWRSIFYVIMALGALVLALIWFLMPETLPRLRPGEKRKMKNPLVAFKYLRYPGVLAVTIMTAWVYGGFYATSVTMPIELKETYDMSPATIGLVLAPQGVALLCGSMLGGRAADYFARGGKPSEYRLISTSIGQLAFVPAILAYGWIIRVNVVATLAIGCVNGFFFTFPRAGISTYSIETISKATGGDNIAGTITGLQYSILYATGGLMSQLGLPVMASIGYGWFFTGVALITLVLIAPVLFMVLRAVRQQPDVIDTTGEQQPSQLEMALHKTRDDVDLGDHDVENSLESSMADLLPAASSSSASSTFLPRAKWIQWTQHASSNVRFQQL